MAWGGAFFALNYERTPPITRHMRKFSGRKSREQINQQIHKLEDFASRRKQKIISSGGTLERVWEPSSKNKMLLTHSEDNEPLEIF